MSIALLFAVPAAASSSYRFHGAKITSVGFVTGTFGPTAVVDISYRKLG